MAKVELLTLILHLSSDEADALWELLDAHGSFNKQIRDERTRYAVHFDLLDVYADLDASFEGCEYSLPLTGTQLSKLKSALKACMEHRPAFFIRSTLWDLQAEIEDLPTHKLRG
jgi:hypothetical protein